MLIGLSGKAGSGKSCVSEMIKDNMSPQGVAVTSFGQHLRQFILRCINHNDSLDGEDFLLTLDREAKDKPFRQVFDFDVDEYQILIQSDILMQKAKTKQSQPRMCIRLKHKLIDTLASYELTLRQVMQIVGTEVVRGAYSNTWVNLARKEVMRLKIDNAVVIINDVVIFNDVRFDNEAELVKALGGDVWEILRYDNNCSGSTDMTHKSEQGVSQGLIDTVVLNDKGLEELREQVIGLIGGKE